MKHQRKIFNTLQGKIGLTFLLIVVCLSIIPINYTKITIANSFYNQIEEKLDSDINYINDLLDQEYKGEWKVIDNNMYKGNINIGDGTLEKAQNDVFDYHLQKTETFSLVFMREYGIDDQLKFIEDKGYQEGHYLRVAGSTKDANGNRIIGTRIQKEVADIIESGEIYKGEANVAGGYIYCKYVPLKNKSNETVGILVVGRNISDLKKVISTLINHCAFIICVSAVIGILIMHLITKLITKNVKQVLYSLNQLEQGDFTVQCSVASKDEIGSISNSLNNMIHAVGQLIHNLKTVSSSVKQSSDQLYEMMNITQETAAAANGSMKKISNESSLQVQNTTIGMDKMHILDNQIKEISLLTDTIYDNATSTNQLGNKGLKSIKHLNTQSINNEKEAFKISKAMIDMDHSINEIGSITYTIGSIAEQTNLLALNASIEAARAGEAGKGFAVVADEVRKLAEQSADASLKVQNLLEIIQKKSATAVHEVENTKQIILQTNEAVKETESIFKHIATAINNLQENILEIKNTTQNIVGIKDEAITTISQILQSTEKNHSNTEEAISKMNDQFSIVEKVVKLTSQLTEISNLLSTDINKFKI